jgi:prolyl-tRNA synthetase
MADDAAETNRMTEDVVERAMGVTRSENFSKWYQAVVHKADLAVNSPVRGCMIIRPNGYGIWERIRYLLNKRIEETGHENLYFPLFIPLSFFKKEATHVGHFAKEMAVVTHHRTKLIGGELAPDPDSLLTDPVVVRPTSELIIGHHFRECVRSYRDLPLLWNQWANVVRWEMRTRLFLRTAEFLWQEGHTAHADREEAVAETRRMLEVYRSFAEGTLDMPVVAGEKPAYDRFGGAESSLSIEAMMQDGKALQAGTSHYLGTNFSEAEGIKYQSKAGELLHCHTTSWGVSTRLIGGVIMTHGDDDGLRTPPTIAPHQIVLVPILRGTDVDGEVLDYCDRLATELRAQTFAGETLRVLIDRRDERAVDKRWSWIARGAPLIAEIGGRDVKSGAITFYRRDDLRDAAGLASRKLERSAFIASAPELLAQIQRRLFADAKTHLDANIITNLHSVGDLKSYFGPSGGDPAPGDEDAEDAAEPVRGWVRAPWSRPSGAALQEVQDVLASLKLSIRVAPLDQGPAGKPCLFNGTPSVEDVLIGRAY